MKSRPKGDRGTGCAIPIVVHRNASSNFGNLIRWVCRLIDVYNMKPTSPFVNTGKYVVPLIGSGWVIEVTTSTYEWYAGGC